MNPLLTSSLLTALLQASLLLTGAWLLILTQRKASAARRSAACRLTMAAAILLFAATLGHTAIALTTNRNPVSVPAALPQGAGFIAENTLLNLPESTIAEKPPPSPAVSLAANAPSTGPLMLSAVHVQWLGAAWLTGAALVLAVWLHSLAARLTLLRRSENATSTPWLEAACEVKGWPLVDEVRLVPQEITPCVWGARKSVLALPASAPAWPAAKLRLVLAHECAHLLRRDPLWQILSRFFLALLWFHPLAWNLARRSRAADEQAADDIVLNTSGDAPSYADLLVECARHFALPPALRTSASAMATRTNLTRRVEAVLNPAADRRPVNSASLLTWAAVITLLTAISSYAVPDISTAPDRETEDLSPEPPSAQTDDQPLFPSNPPTPKPEFRVSSDSIAFPQESPAARKTYILKGSAKIHAHDFTVSADEMALEMQSSQNKPSPGETIDPINLKSIVASGSVVVEGKIDGVELSAKADSLVYTKNPPDQDIILTGWPRLKTHTNLIEGLEQDSKIIIGPKATMRVEKCRISTEPKREQSTKATVTPTETPLAPPTSPPTPETKDAEPPETPAGTESPQSPFDWNIVSLNGLDYLSASQLKSFYRFPTLTIDESGNFFLRSNTMIIKGAPGSNDLFVNNVRFFLKHPVLPSESGPIISRHDLAFILDPIIRPNYIKGFEKVTTVVIDPGHGGTDSGANGAFGKESTYTLDTAQRLQRLLMERGIKTILTRTDDTFMPLKERSAIAAAQSDAILISLHFNQGGAASQQGIITYFPEAPSTPSSPEENPAPSAYYTACLGLATAVHANSLYKIRGTDSGIRPAKYSMISGQTQTPAILIEGGYLSHPGEAARITTEEYRQTLAEAIAGGVQNYIRARAKGAGISR